MSINVEEFKVLHRPVARGSPGGAAKKKGARQAVYFTQMKPPYVMLTELARDNCSMKFAQLMRGDARTAEAELKKVM